MAHADRQERYAARLAAAGIGQRRLRIPDRDLTAFQALAGLARVRARALLIVGAQAESVAPTLSAPTLSAPTLSAPTLSAPTPSAPTPSAPTLPSQRPQRPGPARLCWEDL